MTETTDQPADRAELRDRIAAALYERERPPRDPAWADAFAMDREVFEPMADAVLAVLPAPADRAAILREAAGELGRMDYDTDSNDYGYDTYRDAWNGGVMDGADLLRRMAAEAQQPETQAELASLAMNAANALSDEKRHYEIACQENARLRAVVTRVEQMADHWEQQLPEVIRTPAVVSAIRAALEPAAVSQPGKEA